MQCIVIHDLGSFWLFFFALHLNCMNHCNYFFTIDTHFLLRLTIILINRVLKNHYWQLWGVSIFSNIPSNSVTSNIFILLNLFGEGKLTPSLFIINFCIFLYYFFLLSSSNRSLSFKLFPFLRSSSTLKTCKLSSPMYILLIQDFPLI
jgi:hypothetical protein